MKTMRLEIGDYSLNLKRRLRALLFKSPWLYQSLRFMLGYGVWMTFVRFVSISLITYFNISPQSRFQDIHDSISNTSLIITGFSALGYIALLSALRPMVEFEIRDFYPHSGGEKTWMKGFLQGILWGGGLIFILLITGYYKFIGFYLHPTEAPFEFSQTLLRILAIIGLTYAEGYLFFIKLPQSLHQKMPFWGISLFIAVCYGFTKHLQFDLGVLHSACLSMIALSLYARFLLSGQFDQIAGYWAAFLILLNPLLSLPLFGSEHFGILILKPELQLSSELSPHWITGGVRGPLCSPLFQLFFFLDFMRSMMKDKKKALTGTL